MLRIDRLDITVLPPLTFSVTDGECLAVEGPSGSGKTRLLRAIADLDPAGGYVFLDGLERREMAPEDWRHKVRYVAAEPGWWAPTAREHLSMSPRVDRMVEGLGLTRDHLDRLISDLSTGERQRLALIRALADEARVLLLDEPTASLDSQASAVVEELIKFECLAGRSVVLVSHMSEQIQRLAHARLQLAPPRQSDPNKPELAA